MNLPNHPKDAKGAPGASGANEASHANRANGKKKCSEIICLCNNVNRDSIEKAIADGAQTLNEIFDATTAGVGPCGGSCRRKLGPMLEHYLATGEFLPPQPKPQTAKAKAPKAF